jgi:photosystem II stability/assembly factor-like uncharacterized protein
MGLKSTSAVLAAAACIAVPAAQAAVGAGHSGWMWADPLPQGHTIRALALRGSLGYAAGDFGTALRTDDGGTTWTALATGVARDLSHVAIADENSVVVAGGCSVRRSDDAGVTFARLPWTASDTRCAAPVAALAFPSEQRGYLVLADGTVERTTDGGSSWNASDLPSVGGAGGTPTDVSFTSDEEGVVTMSTGAIYRTADGGTSWVLAHVAPHGLFGVDFAGKLTGLAVGEGSSVVETFDGGATWIDRGGDGAVTLTSVSCANALVCLATTDTGDRLLRTTDGGARFDPIPSTGDVLAASFGEGSRAVAAGRFGQIIVSDDGGARWTPIGSRLGGSFTRLRATSRSLAFAAGLDGTIARTTDAGHTWQPVHVSSSQDITDVSFVDPDFGYALDLTGKLLRTDDGGTSWRIVKTGFSASPQAVLALGDGSVLLIGPHGILRSARRGAPFHRIRSQAARRAKIFEIDRAGRALVAYGSRRVAISLNRGRSWKSVRRPPRALVAAVDFVTRRTGFMLEQNGRLWRTRNRGRTWHDLAAIGTDDAIGLAFSSRSNGYLVLSRFGDDARGYLLRTTDGGRTWRPQLITSSPIDADGIAATGATDLALSTDGSLFFTTSGGDEGAPSSVKITTPDRRLRGRRTIRVSGRVAGAAPGSQVLVGRRFRGESGWDHQLATVGANGNFTTTWRNARTTTYVAQWIGDDDQAGDGSRTITVKVAR